AELSGPLDDLTQQIDSVAEAAGDNETMQRELHRMRKTISKLRRRMESCTTGPRTILGAEQEMHRQEPDPLLMSRRILVADDEPAIRDTLATLLTQKGAQVTVCATGAET